MNKGNRNTVFIKDIQPICYDGKVVVFVRIHRPTVTLDTDGKAYRYALDKNYCKMLNISNSEVVHIKNGFSSYSQNIRHIENGEYHLAEFHLTDVPKAGQSVITNTLYNITSNTFSDSGEYDFNFDGSNVPPFVFLNDNEHIYTVKFRNNKKDKNKKDIIIENNTNTYLPTNVIWEKELNLTTFVLDIRLINGVICLETSDMIKFTYFLNDIGPKYDKMFRIPFYYKLTNFKTFTYRISDKKTDLFPSDEYIPMKYTTITNTKTIVEHNNKCYTLVIAQQPSYDVFLNNDGNGTLVYTDDGNSTKLCYIGEIASHNVPDTTKVKILHSGDDCIVFEIDKCFVVSVKNVFRSKELYDYSKLGTNKYNEVKKLYNSYCKKIIGKENYDDFTKDEIQQLKKMDVYCLCNSSELIFKDVVS